MKLKRLLAFAMICGIVLAACASDNYDNGNEGVLIPADSEIEAAYEKALEAIKWFQFTTIEVDDEDLVEMDGYTFNRVIHDNIRTFADMEEYLKTIFTEELVKWILTEDVRHRDIDGVLYVILADRGGNIFVSDEELHEIIRVSNTEIIYRVSVDVYDRPWMEDDRVVVDVEVHDFVLILVNDNWLFSNFGLVR